MGMGFGVMEFLLMLATAGGGNDLLDYVHTRSYWELKGVTPTVATLTAELGQGKADEKLAPAAAVRRLMAIRTLGELKDKQACDALQPLLKSERLFEADYAQQALAAIEGRPYTRPGAKDIAKDPWLLPAECGLAAQFSMISGKPVDIEKAIKDMAAAGPAALPPNALAEVTKMLVTTAEMTGNIRLHALTVGLAQDMNDDAGFGVAIARGLYDAKAAKEALLKTGELKATVSPEGFDLLQGQNEVAMVLPSNNCFVIIGGPRRGKLPVAALLSALKQGKGSLAPESDLGKIIKSVDTNQPLWAAIKMTPAYQAGEAMLAAFDTVTVVGRIEGDAQKLTLEAVGPDAQKVANAVAEFDQGVAKAKSELEQAAAQVPIAQPILDLLKSIQVRSDGGKATVTGTLKGVTGAAILPLMLFGRSSSAGRGPVEHRHGPAPQPQDF